MKLFEFDKKYYKVHATEEASFLLPFKKILDRDKSKDKDKAMNELAYVWFFADITSPYQSIIDEKERGEEIIRDIDLPKNWKADKAIEEAISFYKNRDKTAVHNLYDAAMIAAESVNEVFKKSRELILESDDSIAAAAKVIQALEKVPKVMESLRSIEKELIRQIEDHEGKKKGSRSFNTFEDGLNFNE